MKLTSPLPLLALLAWAGLSACSTEITHASDRVVVHWSPPVRALAWALPMLAVLSGLGLLRTVRWASTGFACLLLSVLAIPFSAAILADELVLTETEVYDRAGFPWNRYNRGFALEGLQRVSLSTQRVRNRRSSHEETLWHLDYGSDAENATLSPGSLWDASREIILEHLEDAGVAIGPDLSEYLPFIPAIDAEMEARLRVAPLDAADPTERMRALFRSGAWRDLRRKGDSAPLGDPRVQDGGIWQAQANHEGQSYALRLQLHTDGSFDYEVESAGKTWTCQGTWTVGSSSWTLTLDGSSWETLFPKPAS